MVIHCDDYCSTCFLLAAIDEDVLGHDDYVFDAGSVAELQPEIVHDFPGGAPRYVQGSKGYKATVVNGKINFIDGELTGAANGEVLRHIA